MRLSVLALLRVALLADGASVAADSAANTDVLLSVPHLVLLDKLTPETLSNSSTGVVSDLEQHKGFLRACFLTPTPDPASISLGASEIYIFTEWSSLDAWRAAEVSMSRIMSDNFNYKEFKYLRDNGGFRTTTGGSFFEAVSWNCTAGSRIGGVSSLGPVVPIAAAAAGASPALEFLHHYNVRPADMTRWLAEDDAIWTSFLAKADGYVAKMHLLPYAADLANATEAYSTVHWASLDAWKAIPGEDLGTTDAEFEKAMGYYTPLEALPGDNGFSAASAHTRMALV